MSKLLERLNELEGWIPKTQENTYVAQSICRNEFANTLRALRTTVERMEKVKRECDAFDDKYGSATAHPLFGFVCDISLQLEMSLAAAEKEICGEDYLKQFKCEDIDERNLPKTRADILGEDKQ